jgi:hypothetical protein
MVASEFSNDARRIEIEPFPRGREVRGRLVNEEVDRGRLGTFRPPVRSHDGHDRERRLAHRSLPGGAGSIADACGEHDVAMSVANRTSTPSPEGRDHHRPPTLVYLSTDPPVRTQPHPRARTFTEGGRVSHGCGPMMRSGGTRFMSSVRWHPGALLRPASAWASFRDRPITNVRPADEASWRIQLLQSRGEVPRVPPTVFYRCALRSQLLPTL